MLVCSMSGVYNTNSTTKVHENKTASFIFTVLNTAYSHINLQTETCITLNTQWQTPRVVVSVSTSRVSRWSRDVSRDVPTSNVSSRSGLEKLSMSRSRLGLGRQTSRSRAFTSRAHPCKLLSISYNVSIKSIKKYPPKTFRDFFTCDESL